MGQSLTGFVPRNKAHFVSVIELSNPLLPASWNITQVKVTQLINHDVTISKKIKITLVILRHIDKLFYKHYQLTNLNLRGLINPQRGYKVHFIKRVFIFRLRM